MRLKVISHARKKACCGFTKPASTSHSRGAVSTTVVNVINSHTQCKGHYKYRYSSQVAVLTTVVDTFYYFYDYSRALVTRSVMGYAVRYSTTLYC